MLGVQEGRERRDEHTDAHREPQQVLLVSLVLPSSHVSRNI